MAALTSQFLRSIILREVLRGLWAFAARKPVAPRAYFTVQVFQTQNTPITSIGSMAPKATHHHVYDAAFVVASRSLQALPFVKTSLMAKVFAPLLAALLLLNLIGP